MIHVALREMPRDVLRGMLRVARRAGFFIREEIMGTGQQETQMGRRGRGASKQESEKGEKTTLG